MKVLILTNYFPPEISGGGRLYYELASGLAEKGHTVTVVTGFPRRNLPERPPEYRGKLFMAEEMDDVRVLRVPMLPLPRKPAFIRGLDHFLIAMMLFIGGLWAGRHDVVVFYSPPLPIGLSAWLLSRLWGMAFVPNIQDLFPIEAVLLGVLRQPLLIRFFEAIESFIYRHADHVTVHSPGNVAHIVAHGGSPDRVSVIYNWVDTGLVRPAEKDNEFRRKHNLDGKFVVSYAGTMGWAQDMMTIVRCAERLQEHPDILFLLVGNGLEKQKAMDEAERRGLHNILWLPMQPFDVYLQILAASDASMLNLNGDLTTPVVPSKIKNIMAAGRPVVASLPLNGDAPQIVREAQCGYCVEAGDDAGLAEAILRLYRNPAEAEQLGQNGRRYAEAHFARQICVQQYEKLLARVIAERRQKT